MTENNLPMLNDLITTKDKELPTLEGNIVDQNPLKTMDSMLKSIPTSENNKDEQLNQKNILIEPNESNNNKEEEKQIENMDEKISESNNKEKEKKEIKDENPKNEVDQVKDKESKDIPLFENINNNEIITNPETVGVQERIRKLNMSIKNQEKLETITHNTSSNKKISSKSINNDNIKGNENIVDVKEFNNNDIIIETKKDKEPLEQSESASNKLKDLEMNLSNKLEEEIDDGKKKHEYGSYIGSVKNKADKINTIITKNLNEKNKFNPVLPSNIEGKSKENINNSMVIPSNIDMNNINPLIQQQREKSGKENQNENNNNNSLNCCVII